MEGFYKVSLRNTNYDIDIGGIRSVKEKRESLICNLNKTIYLLQSLKRKSQTMDYALIIVC